MDMTGGRQFHKITRTFDMQHGSLESPVVAYETWGLLNHQRDNAILLFTGLSPSAHAASSPNDQSVGRWEQMLGPGRPLDTTKYFIICINSLGSCFGSTGPGSINPATGEAYRLAFPVVTLEDIARAGHEVVEHFELEHLHAVLGASMGGMTALAYSVLFPAVAKSLVSISSAARSQPYAIALRSLQREIICNDPDWMHGNYPLENPPRTGLRLARKLGMLTYRSAEEFEQRFGRELISEQRFERYFFKSKAVYQVGSAVDKSV
jgi:homoserine O-acetyltransferase